MAEFHFLRPYWFLALFPLLLLLWLFHRRRSNSRTWQSVCDAALLPYILVGTNQVQRRWPLLLLALMGLLGVLSLAGPVWEQLEQPVFREQSALVVVLDLSRSMDAADIKSSRLARARHKINDILKRRQEGQTALVVYAGDAHVVSPLTQDSATIVNLLNTLATELMPLQGSRTDKALVLAVTLLQQSGVTAGHILLVTDGVAESRIDKVSVLVGERGHRLSVLGVGTEQGAPISIAGGGYLKDRSGSIVLPRLEPDHLRHLAQQSGGRYHGIRADDADLNYLLATDKRMDFDRKQDDTSLLTDQWREEGPWLLLLIIPFAALAFRRGYLVLLAFVLLPLLPQPAQALEWRELWSRPDQQAARLLQQGTGDLPAAEVFNDPAWRAAAHYRLGQYQQAVDVLQDASSGDDLYNKGNALARLGRLDEAIASYDQALEQMPGDEDIEFNRDLVQQQLDKKDKQSSDDGDSGDEQPEQREGDGEPGEDEGSSASEGNESSDNGQEQGDQSDSNADGKDALDGSEAGESDSSSTMNEEESMADQEKNSQENEEKGASQDELQGAPDADDLKQSEVLRATEQWLRRIPDDPGGLLRKKFLYESQRKQQSKQAVDESSPW